MKNISKKELETITKKLKPFWDELCKLRIKYFKKIEKIEERMNNAIKPPTKLEFFYCDGAYCGIGAKNYTDRKWFKLISDTDLNGDSKQRKIDKSLINQIRRSLEDIKHGRIKRVS